MLVEVYLAEHDLTISMVVGAALLDRRTSNASLPRLQSETNLTSFPASPPGVCRAPSGAMFKPLFVTGSPLLPELC